MTPNKVGKTAITLYWNLLKWEIGFGIWLTPGSIMDWCVLYLTTFDLRFDVDWWLIQIEVQDKTLPLTSNSGISIIVNESSNQVISLIGFIKSKESSRRCLQLSILLSFYHQSPGLTLKNVEISSICKGRSLYRSARSNPRVGCVRPQDAVYC